MNTILVTGATGNVGRPPVNELAEAGVPVRAVTRSPDSAQFPTGVEVVRSAADGIRGASAVISTHVRSAVNSRRSSNSPTTDQDR